MLEFIYEEQETARFLVYKKKESDRVDNAVVGIASGSRIDGVLKLLPIRIDEELFFKYNVTGLCTLQEYLSGYVEKKRLLHVLEELTDILLDAPKYMLDAGDFVLQPEYIFVDTAAFGCHLVILPVEGKRTEVKPFFISLISNVNTDITNDNTVGRLLQFFHPSQRFSLEGLKSLLYQLKNEQEIRPQILVKKDFEKEKSSSVEDSEATVLMDVEPTVLLGPRLICLRTQNSFSVTKEISLIGRNPAKNDFCIEDNPEIGREAHASILWKAGEIFIKDNHSHNGVFLNGQKIEMDKWVGPLLNGSHFNLAREEFEVQLNEGSTRTFLGQMNTSSELSSSEKEWKDFTNTSQDNPKKGFLQIFKKEGKKAEKKEKKKEKKSAKHSFGNFSIPGKEEK